ncbi:MAG TPA: energy transducer TonB [Terriglobia bacterium]|nr:energy transducer TonB [Terriglobia bacterium]
MAQERAPQINLLSHESRREALRGGLSILFSRMPSQKKLSANGQNGNGANFKPPQINLLAHEPRRKVLTRGLATLLRKYPVAPAILQQGISTNGHRIPGFKLLSYESRRQAIRGGFKSLFLKDPPPQPLIVGQQEVGVKEGPKLTAFLTSCLMHFSIVFFLLEVPFFFLMPRSSQNFRLPQIVYEFHEIELPRDLPSVKPPGPGGQPGRGTHPEKAPARGSSAFHHSATVVSNPPNPDNNFQTIIQPHINPAQKLDIKLKLRLPNVVLGGTLPVPGPPAPPPPPPPMKLTAPPALKSLTIPKTTVVSVKPPDLTIPASDMPNMPAIPVPPPPLPPLQQRKDAPKNLDLTAIATQGMQATSNGSVTSLLSLSLNPGPPTEKLSIPAGNRYGAFTISPEGNHPGSPYGDAGGSESGGSGGPGGGGDASTGVGSGTNGGGGGGPGANGLAVSTTGNAGAAGAVDGGTLSSASVAKLVFPILRAPLKNRFAMVVTAGPQGGGGLHVFGVLKGGKIYTIFLPMPQRNWILQYSQVDGTSAPQKAQRNGVALQVDFGIVPPAVENRFDFHRPTLTAEQKQKMIILHGFIGADGSVEKLTVYRGVENLADQAAQAAFEKWKFQPAVRNGKPIPIEILLGIPLS